VIKLVALLKRKPGISRDVFARRWVEEHARISSELPGLVGYRINIASERQPSGASDEPLYDGTAEMWWESVDAMEAAFETEVGRLAGADADEFAEVRIHVYTDEHVVIAGPER
jgi:uncharacterized protein (TIGR02118 family)